MCQGLAFCDGSAGGLSCKGACHLYTTSKTPGLGAGWAYDQGQGGDPHKISKLTSEPWWHCYSKSTEPEPSFAATAIVQAGKAQSQLYPELMGPVKSNVSSGIIGMNFVEVRVIVLSLLLFATVTSLAVDLNSCKHVDARARCVYVVSTGLCALLYRYCRPQPSSSAKECIVRSQYCYCHRCTEHDATKRMVVAVRFR